MAESNNIAAPFPAPPPFFKHFTKQNQRRLRQITRATDVDAVTSNGNGFSNIASLPSELRYLIPPEPPSDDKYSSFGADIDLGAPDPDLAAAQIEQLYPSHASVRLSPQAHLIALARSSLTTFLSLTGVMSQNPELYQDRAQDLQTIMYNMHDLINHYRPHQARETLVLMMEERVEKMKNEIKAVDEAKDKVANLLQELETNGLAQQLAHEGTSAQNMKAEDSVNDIRKVRQRAAWNALGSEMA